MGRYLKLKVSVDSAGADTASEVVMAKQDKKKACTHVSRLGARHFVVMDEVSVLFVELEYGADVVVFYP